jgi:hypothetical protein
MGSVETTIHLIRGSVMAAPAYEWQRIKRVLWPSKYDHTAYMLIGICGRYWLLLAGFKREYRVIGKQGFVIIDLAHPRLKLALEADGEQWHMDIVKEQRRDETLMGKGWSVKHYRYPALKNEPKRVRREVRRWYWQALLFRYRPK